MGVYYNAASIIGFRLSKQSTIEKVKLPNCDHNPTNAKFCPSCGKKVGTHIEVNLRPGWHIFRYRFIEGDTNVSENVQALNDIEKCPKRYIFEEDDDYFWFGFGGTADHEEGRMTKLPDDLGVIKSNIRDLLAPFVSIGLFVLNEDDFGLWTTLIGH